MKEKTLRVGEISYTNCFHIYYCLKQNIPLNGVEYIQGTPTQLNSMLHQGSLDLCLSSSIEYARNSSDYVVLPRFCIASRGPVPSIRLFSRLSLDELNGARVVLTDESATTVALCRIILSRLLGYENEFVTLAADLEDGLQQGDAVLLIGDRALAANARTGQIHSHDLSLAWQEHTGFPFVFALWILRTGAVRTHGPLLASFWRALGKAHQQIVHPQEELVREALEQKTFFTRRQLLDYWQLVACELTADHLKGLELFYSLAYECGLIPARPEIEFYDPEKNIFD